MGVGLARFVRLSRVAKGNVAGNRTCKCPYTCSILYYPKVREYRQSICHCP